MEVPAKDIDACRRVGKRVIVKFLIRKDCQQVLSVIKGYSKDYFLRLSGFPDLSGQ